MALLTVAEIKSYLRIQSTAEDTLLDVLLTQAKALVEAMMQRPITAVERSFTDEAQTQVAYGVVTKLLVPVTPVDWSTLVITDVDGNVLVEDTDYRTGDAWTGEVFAMPGVAFNAGPYSITAEVGLSFDAEYATRYEPLVNAALLDCVADLWHRRNPSAAMENTGGGIGTQYQQGSYSGTPERMRQTLGPLCRVRVV